MNDSWFTETRGGLFIHYGLYSLLGRGEWVWNREAIPREESKRTEGRMTSPFSMRQYITRCRSSATPWIAPSLWRLR